MKKLRLRKPNKKADIPTRITNETVAEHRKRILAGGRRFKYPMQYARHRLVINAILLTVAALVVLAFVTWQQLYVTQNTGTFFYRLTRIIPLPVASVNGELVRYSDYLMYYNSSVHYLQQSEQTNLNSPDGKRQVAYIKRKTLDKAISDAYVQQLADQLKIKVSHDELKQANEDHLNTANGRISQETYDASTQLYYGWNRSEEQASVKSQLLKNSVAFAIDTTAKQQVDKASVLVKQNNVDFEQIAAQLGGQGSAKVTAGTSGLVPLINGDGGLAKAASKLQKGQTTGPIQATTGDGYYFVKLLDKNDTQLNYAFLKIPLTELDNRLAALKKDGKIKEYINVPQV